LVSHRQSDKRISAGFTLLELLVVLTIAGLLVTLVPPLYSKAVPGARLKMAARDFAGALREARSRAVGTGRPIDISLAGDPPSYVIGDDGAIELPRSVFMATENYFANSGAPPFGPMAVEGRSLAIRFYPDGSSTGAIVNVSNGSATYRVTVSWLIGAIKVSEVAGDGI